MDPDYCTNGFLTQKTDVYSFGVVLCEVLCGRLAHVEYKDEPLVLSISVQKHYKSGTLDSIIPSDLYKQMNTDSLVTFSNIAYKCLMNGQERPTMRQVVKQLQKALQNQLESYQQVKKQEEGKKVEEEAKQAAGDKKKGEESKDGVEDHKTRQIIVNRGKVDPLKVLARVKNKNHQKVKLLPLTEEPKKLEQGEPYKQKEVVLSVDLHCQGCARKVRQCLKNFEGVERVLTDCDNHMVVVKGKNLNLLKVIERVKKKLRRDVELLSPVSKSLTEEPKKLEQQEPPKQEEKKDEPLSVITVVLKVHMHCEACARDIRKCILRMKGVESAVADLNNSQVTVKGTFSAVEIVDHVHKKTGKGVVILMQDHDIS